MAKKAALTFGVSILIAAYKAFVLMLMWNWFVSPVFHSGNITFWQVLGLLWLVQLFIDTGAENSPDKTVQWENLFLILDACVPEEKREEIRAAVANQNNQGIWGQIGMYLGSQFLGSTLTLVLGLAVHTFLV